MAAAAVVDIIATVDCAACGNNWSRILNGVGEGDRRKKPFFVDDTDAEETDDDGEEDGIVVICGGVGSLFCVAFSISLPYHVSICQKQMYKKWQLPK